MGWGIQATRRRLRRWGWSAEGVPLVTLDGQQLWFVSVRRGKQRFTVQGRTPRLAWAAAARLAERLELHREEQPVILQFSAPHRRPDRQAA
jgi:hypothetical protein